MSVFSEENLTPMQRSMRELVKESRESRPDLDKKLNNFTRGGDGANLQNQENIKNTEHEHQKMEVNSQTSIETSIKNSKSESEQVELKVGEVVLRWQRLKEENGSAATTQGHENNLSEKDQEQKLQRRGRPRLNKEDQSVRVSVFFGPTEIKEIDRNSDKDKGGRPKRSEYIRSRIRRLKDFEKRELRQMKLFKNILGQMKGEIEGVIKDSEALYGESTQSKLKMKNLEKRAQEIEMVFNLVQFDQKSLDQGLNRTEMQNFRFAMDLAKSRSN